MKIFLEIGEGGCFKSFSRMDDLGEMAGVESVDVARAELTAAKTESGVKTWARRALLAATTALALSPAAHAEEAQTDTNDPFAVASNETVSDPFAVPTEPKPSLTSIAANTALERTHEKLSAEDEAAIVAYQEFLETGELTPTFRNHLQTLVDRYNAGDFDDSPETKAMIDRMSGNAALLAIL